MEIRKYPKAIIAWEKGTDEHGNVIDVPVGHVRWRTICGCWYIDFVTIVHPKVLIALMTTFRTVWRERGKPRLTLEAKDRNAPMMRMLKLLGVEKGKRFYRIENLDMLSANRQARLQPKE